MELLELRGSGATVPYVPGPAAPPMGPEEGRSGGSSQGTLPGLGARAPADRGEFRADGGELPVDRGESRPDRGESPADRGELPEGLRALIHRLGPRTRRKQLHDALVALARVRPWTAGELAGLLGRKDTARLVERHLSPLVREGRLRWTHPEEPNHPEQAYTAPDEEAP